QRRPPVDRIQPLPPTHHLPRGGQHRVGSGNVILGCRRFRRGKSLPRGRQRHPSRLERSLVGRHLLLGRPHRLLVPCHRLRGNAPPRGRPAPPDPPRPPPCRPSPSPRPPSPSPRRLPPPARRRCTDSIPSSIRSRSPFPSSSQLSLQRNRYRRPSRRGSRLPASTGLPSASQLPARATARPRSVSPRRPAAPRQRT